MDNFQKYSRLMLLLAGGMVAFILGLGLLIFILRLFSSTLLHVPGFDSFYGYIVLIIPYLIFFTAYYYLFKNARRSKSRFSRVAASAILSVSILVCSFCLLLSTLIFAGVKGESLKVFEENSGYGFALQLALVLIITMLIAAGETKEKDWMQRNVKS